jgi:hypothetical protein
VIRIAAILLGRGDGGRRFPPVVAAWSERWQSDVHAWWFDGRSYPDPMDRVTAATER